MNTEPISVEMLRGRFSLKSNRGAAALMRRMRHVTTGGRLYTTEGWLAEWLAAEAVPAMNWPPKHVVYDPLDECVNSMVLKVIGHLADLGAIKVVGSERKVTVPI